MKSFEETIKQDPSFIKAYINLGVAYGKLKNYPEALEVLNKALRIDKDNAKIYYNLGMIASSMGKTSKAKKHFKNVFKPGYTTKKRGWGLGLSLAKRIIENYHKGKIFVLISELNKGSIFRIQLKK